MDWNDLNDEYTPIQEHRPASHPTSAGGPPLLPVLPVRPYPQRQGGVGFRFWTVTLVISLQAFGTKGWASPLQFSCQRVQAANPVDASRGRFGSGKSFGHDLSWECVVMWWFKAEVGCVYMLGKSHSLVWLQPSSETNSAVPSQDMYMWRCPHWFSLDRQRQNYWLVLRWILVPIGSSWHGRCSQTGSASISVALLRLPHHNEYLSKKTCKTISPNGPARLRGYQHTLSQWIS